MIFELGSLVLEAIYTVIHFNFTFGLFLGNFLSSCIAPLQRRLLTLYRRDDQGSVGNGGTLVAAIAVAHRGGGREDESAAGGVGVSGL